MVYGKIRQREGSMLQSWCRNVQLFPPGRGRAIRTQMVEKRLHLITGRKETKEATMPGIIGSLLLTAIISYLWGSLPSGYWMGKLLRGKDFDIRDYGSRKIGATNVLRTLGRIPAIFVFILDISKGVGPALLATFVPLFQGNGWGIFVAGLMALLGHCFPVFIGFKGG